MKFLIKDKRVDVTSKRNYPIRIAAKYGHPNVVKFLLLDQRTNPMDTETCNALNYSIGNGNIEVLDILMKDKRIGDKYLKESFIQSLCNDTIMCWLIKNKEVSIEIKQEFLEDIVENNLFESIKILTKDDNITFSDICYNSIKNSANKSYKIVKFLIEQEKIDTNNYLNDAANYGDLKLFKLLLNDTKSIVNMETVECALESNNIKIIKEILKSGYLGYNTILKNIDDKYKGIITRCKYDLRNTIIDSIVG